MVTSHLSERSLVQNRVAQIPKFDAKPNHNFNPDPSPNSNPMPIRFGQMTLRTSELSPFNITGIMAIKVASVRRVITITRSSQVLANCLLLHFNTQYIVV